MWITPLDSKTGLACSNYAVPAFRTLLRKRSESVFCEWLAYVRDGLHLPSRDEIESVVYSRILPSNLYRGRWIQASGSELSQRTTRRAT